jgi:hypothetical protein
MLRSKYNLFLHWTFEVGYSIFDVLFLSARPKGVNLYFSCPSTLLIQAFVLSCLPVKPRFCSRRRSEAPQTTAKREVGTILGRRHNHYYVEEQNRETSVAARICKP